MAAKFTEHGLPVIDTRCGRFVLGAKTPDPQVRASFRTYANSYPTVPRAEWQERDYRFYKVPVMNQGTHGSCSGHASVGAFEYNRRFAGMDWVDLSPTFPYAQLNGGRDQGASVSDNMTVLEQLGTCTRAECGVDQIFKQQIQQPAYQSALKYRLKEAFVLRSFDDLGSAITLFGPAALGILIGNNFAQIDRNGVCPLPDVTAGGHALCAVGLKQIAGEWMVLFQNSWGVKFGIDGGFAYITEQHTYKMFDGFALVLPVDPAFQLSKDQPHAKEARLLQRRFGVYKGPIEQEIVVNVPADPPKEPKPEVKPVTVKPLPPAVVKPEVVKPLPPAIVKPEVKKPLVESEKPILPQEPTQSKPSTEVPATPPMPVLAPPSLQDLMKTMTGKPQNAPKPQSKKEKSDGK